MGYFEGFGVTLKQHRLFGGKRDHGQLLRWPCRAQARRRLAGRSQDDRKAPKPERLHGRHVLNRYEDGMEKCIGCELCAGVCPAKCIHVRGADNDPDNPTSPGERYGYVVRDQLPAVHPLRSLRRGLPHRGDHRDEDVRVLVHEPR